jgi:hypothetical protein
VAGTRLEHSLGEKATGSWAAFTVGLMVSRQNGKGSILEARELAGLFLLGERFLSIRRISSSTSSGGVPRLRRADRGHPFADEARQAERASSVRTASAASSSRRFSGSGSGPVPPAAAEGSPRIA